MLLALDTSTRLASIALYSGERGLISECCWHSANRHTVELMPAVARMLAQAGLRSEDLQATAVALGPGSFTGLRVALAAAKGLALAGSISLLGIPTLDVVAYPHRDQSLPVVALVQAGRGRVCWAPYGKGSLGWGALAAYGLSTIADLAESTMTPTFFAGELLAADRAQLSELLGAHARLATPALATRRAGYLAEMAWARFAAGERDAPDSLTPIYLHSPTKHAGASGA